MTTPLLRTLRLPLVVLTGLLALPAAAAAQNPPAAAPPPPPKHEGTAELAFVGTTGNTHNQTLSAGAEYIARPTNWLIKNRFNVVRGDTDSTLTTESWFYGFRAERTLNARTSAFGEYGYFRDQFAGIDARSTVNGGLSFKAVTSDRQTLNVDGGLGYLNEQRLAGTDVSSATWSGGAAYKIKLSDNAELTDEIRLLGTFDIADDWRLANVLAVTAKLTSAFSLKFSNTVRFMNAPPPGFDGTDTVTSIAFVAAFKSKAK